MEGLNKRMEKFVNETYLVTATVIDPRYKLIPFNDEISRLSVKRQVLYELNSRCSSQPGVPDFQSLIAKRSRTTEDPIEEFLLENEENYDDTVTTEPTSLDVELDDYLKERTILSTADPLDYWRTHKSDALKKIAIRFLTPPPSSVESERVFSTMGSICIPKRWKLTGEHAKAQLFLHHHY